MQTLGFENSSCLKFSAAPEHEALWSLARLFLSFGAARSGTAKSRNQKLQCLVRKRVRKF